MITIFITTNPPIIQQKQIEETTLVVSSAGTFYRADIGFEGIGWHRNLGKAKEYIRQWKANQINNLKNQILNIKRLSIVVVKI